MPREVPGQPAGPSLPRPAPSPGWGGTQPRPPLLAAGLADGLSKSAAPVGSQTAQPAAQVDPPPGRPLPQGHA